MKKTLYLLTGLSWGIMFSNPEILWFAIIMSVFTIFIEIMVDEK